MYCWDGSSGNHLELHCYHELLVEHYEAAQSGSSNAEPQRLPQMIGWLMMAVVISHTHKYSFHGNLHIAITLPHYVLNLFWWKCTCVYSTNYTVMSHSLEFTWAALLWPWYLESYRYLHAVHSQVTHDWYDWESAQYSLHKCYTTYVYPIRRTVTKEGKNKGRVFYACSRPKDDRCDYFIFQEGKKYADILDLESNTSDHNNCW